jgi:hypothetical protein
MDCESLLDFRLDGFLDRVPGGYCPCEVDVGLDERRERLDAVEGAPEARRDIAGEGGAGREDVNDEVDSGRGFGLWAGVVLEDGDGT